MLLCCVTVLLCVIVLLFCIMVLVCCVIVLVCCVKVFAFQGDEAVGMVGGRCCGEAGGIVGQSLIIWQDGFVAGGGGGCLLAVMRGCVGGRVAIWSKVIRYLPRPSNSITCVRFQANLGNMALCKVVMKVLSGQAGAAQVRTGERRGYDPFIVASEYDSCAWPPQRENRLPFTFSGFAAVDSPILIAHTPESNLEQSYFCLTNSNRASPLRVRSRSWSKAISKAVIFWAVLRRLLSAASGQSCVSRVDVWKLRESASSSASKRN